MLKRGTSCRAIRLSDRLGPAYDDVVIQRSLRAKSALVEVADVPSLREIAEKLKAGQVIARFQGRSEFGPRALGGRSLLASPLLSASKKRLNAIKGRQEWRPIAPVIIGERVLEFFEGPANSPYMNFVHVVRTEHREALAALFHPDASTRVQTLDRADDPGLYDLLVQCGELTCYPLLANTSLNGPGEPMVETPEDAIAFFLSHQDINLLLFDNYLVSRRSKLFHGAIRLAPDTIVTLIYPSAIRRIILLRRNVSMEISGAMFDWLQSRHYLKSDVPRNSDDGIDQQIESEVFKAMCLGLVVEDAACDR